MKFKKVDLGRIVLKNPLIIASGTGSFGKNSDNFAIDYSEAGAFITKTITLLPREGNPPPRILEVSSGILNYVGLENPGLEGFIDILNNIEISTTYLVSIAAKNDDELLKIITALEKYNIIQGYELNLSCPNVQHSTVMPYLDENYVKNIVKSMRKLTNKFFSVKLPPYTGIKYSTISEEEGADALTVSNTYPGISFYIDDKFVSGGISGPAIKPMMLYNVYQITKIVNIPVIASGGLQNASDVNQALKIGASAVQLGSINMIYPNAVSKIINE